MDDDWQPIETAPVKQPVLVCQEGDFSRHFVAQVYRKDRSSKWHYYHSRDLLCFTPTHWQRTPMPKNPRPRPGSAEP